MRIALVILVALALAGCGASDEDRIRETFVAYRDAFLRGDGERACEQLTEDGRGEFAASIGAKSCPEAVGKARKALSKDERTQFATLRVVQVTVDEDRGVLAVSAQQDELPTGWRMVKEGDAWLLD